MFSQRNHSHCYYSWQFMLNVKHEYPSIKHELGINDTSISANLGLFFFLVAMFSTLAAKVNMRS